MPDPSATLPQHAQMIRVIVLQIQVRDLTVAQIDARLPFLRERSLQFCKRGFQHHLRYRGEYGAIAVLESLGPIQQRAGPVHDVGNGWHRISLTGPNNSSGNKIVRVSVYPRRPNNDKTKSCGIDLYC
jgi:hypothetical protein